MYTSTYDIPVNRYYVCDSSPEAVVASLILKKIVVVAYSKNASSEVKKG